MAETRDSIADIWGHGPPIAANGRSGSTSGRSRSPSAGCSRLRPLLERLRHGHRRQGRADRRRPGPGRRPRQPRPARAEGAPRLGGQPQPRPPDAPPDPPRRQAQRGELGRGDGPRSSSSAAEVRDEVHRRGDRHLQHAASSSSRSTTRSAVIGKAGLGTPHMDGNTRLCTATAARGPHRDRSAPTASPARTPTSTRRRAPAGRPQRRLAADRPLDAHPRPARRARTRRSSS